MIEEIRRRVSDGRLEFSKHAVDQSIVRNIEVKEIREAISDGEIIEDYPDDKYGPSCLVYGTTVLGRPIHVHCSYPARDYLKIITVYEPDAESWEGFRVRKNE